MNDWSIKCLVDCIDRVQYPNKIPKKKFLDDGDFPIISQEKDLINGYWSNKDDVFSVLQPIVIFGDHTKVLKFIDFDFVIGADGVKVLQPKSFLDPKYFYYYLNAFPVKSLGYARHYRLLKELDIKFPPLPEQKRIVAILDEAFAGIAQSVANAEKNLANARELFESYLKSVFTQKGESWQEKPLKDVCVLQRGFDLPKRLRLKGNFPLVSSSGIIDAHIEAKVVGPGVATGRSGSIGNVFYIEQDFWPLNTVLYVKEFHGNIQRFIYYLLKQFDLSKYASGAGVPTLNRNHVHSIPVNIPSDLSEQRKIANHLDLLSSETQYLETIYQRKLDALAELKQSILQKAFNGELTN